MKDNIETRVMGMFLIMLIIIGLMAIKAITTINRSKDLNAFFLKSLQTIEDTDAVVSSMRAGDAALAKYLLTGNQLYQDAYRGAYKEMADGIQHAQADTRDASEQEQHQQFVKLEDLMTNHIDFARTAVQAREQGGVPSATQALTQHSDAQTTAAIQSLVKAVKDKEHRLLTQRDTESRLQAQNTQWTLLSGVAVNLVLLGFVFWLMRDDLAARRKAAVALEEANAQLEVKVQQRTAELVQANASLKKENLENRWSNQALDHQLRYSKLIIDSLSELVFVVSKVLNISRINPAVLHLTKWDPQDLIAQSLDRVVRFSPDGPINPILLALNEGREIQERPALVVSKDGVSIPVRLNVVPVRDDNKVVGGVITARPDSPAAQRRA